MKKILIMLATVQIIVLNVAQAQDNTPRKELSHDEYSIYMEKSKLGRQYVYRVDASNKKEEVRLPKGNYFLGNKNSAFFEFSIDGNGYLCDSARCREKQNIATFYYDKGFAVRVKSVNPTTGALYSEAELKSLIQIATIYYPSGQIEERDSIHLLNDAEIAIHYAENGNIEWESNQVKDYYKTYYKNGNLRRFDDEHNKTYIYYNEDGSISEYNSASERKTYFYKDKQLSYYVVYDRENDISKIYDAQNILIKKSHGSDISSMIKIED